jgi:IS5 family transposase
VDADNPGLTITHRGRAKRLDAEGLKLIKRRNAIEPVIGHLKADHRMDRCHLKGEIDDRLHAVLCAAGYNIRWLLRAIVRKGVTAFLRLLPAPAVAAVVPWLAGHRDLVAFMRPSNQAAVA